VVIHNPVIVDKNNIKKSISTITYSQLREISSASGYRIPTFEETVKTFGNKIAMNIEVKVKGIEKEVIKILESGDLKYDYVISSFMPTVINEFYRLDSKLQLGLILGLSRINLFNIFENVRAFKLIDSGKISNLHLHWKLTGKAIIKKLTSMGMRIYIWTVDDPDSMKSVIDTGAHGIFTNKPDILRDLLKRSNKNS
jgi:glycerophosphoryl diester phosphodiesterase